MLVGQSRFIRDEAQMLMGVPQERRQDLQEEIIVLEQDWNAAINEMNTNRADIENRLQLWRDYKSILQRLSSWLIETEKERLELQIKHAPIKKVEKVLLQVQVRIVIL